MRCLITALTPALLALVLAPAALAQQAPTEPPDGVTDERFSTQETRELSRQVSEAEARYERNEKRIDTLTENMEMGPERDRLMEENAEMDETNPKLREDLVDARYEAIQDFEAPEGGEERVAALEAKEDALAQLLDYSGEVYGDSFLSEDVDKTEEIEAELEATGDEIEAAEDAAEQEEPAAQEESQDSSGAAASAGDSGGSGSSETGGIGPFGPTISAGLVGFGLALALVAAVAVYARTRRPRPPRRPSQPATQPATEDDDDGPIVGG